MVQWTEGNHLFYQIDDDLLPGAFQQKYFFRLETLDYLISMLMMPCANNNGINGIIFKY